jgi:hypothetical protein
VPTQNGDGFNESEMMGVSGFLLMIEVYFLACAL